jgi:undecaprenyl-diphosphatase
VPFEDRLWALAASFFLLFIALGIAVSIRPASRLELLGAGVRGHATDLAIALTTSGRGPFLLAFSVVACVAFAVARESVLVPVGVIVSQTLSQGVVELIKHRFHRIRPDNWIAGRELGYSFPSGHATTSVVFYGAWLTLAVIAPIPTPLRLALVALLLCWMLGIDWSRLALAAHYATDIVGGTLFGLGWLFATWAVFTHLHLLTHAPTLAR